MNHSNNAFSVLNGSITNVATALTVATGTGSRFPASNFMVTLIGYDGLGNENAWEICLCTSRSGDVLTVVRGQESTTAVAWANATRIENRLTAGTMGNLMYLDKGGTITAPVTLMNGAYTAFKVGLTGLVSIGGEAGSADSRFTITDGGAVGMEFSQTAIAGQNRILSYDRLASAFVPMSLAASEVRFNISGTDAVTINGSGVTGITRAMVGLADALTGPASATDNSLPRFDGTTGKLIQGSGVVVSDTNSFETNVGATYGGYRVKGTSSASNGFELALSSNGVTGNIWLYENAALRFATNNTERMTLDSSGNLALSSGAFGYGAGAGGTVTQATSKTTGVTLNKPSGLITTHNAALAANTSVEFVLTNSFVSATDVVVLNLKNASIGFKYRAQVWEVVNGGVYIQLTNITGGSLSEAVPINFAVIKGSTT